jgi:hypothetical protein
MGYIASAVERTCSLGPPLVGAGSFEEAAFGDRVGLGDEAGEGSFGVDESVEGELQRPQLLAVVVFGCCGSNLF